MQKPVLFKKTTESEAPTKGRRKDRSSVGTLRARWKVVAPSRDAGCGKRGAGSPTDGDRERASGFDRTTGAGCGSTTPLDCNVRKPRGLPGKSWVERIPDRDEAPPISERNTWRANVQMRRSQASGAVLARDHMTQQRCGYIPLLR